MKQDRHDRFSFEPQWLVVIGFFCVGLFLGALGVFTWITNKQKTPIKKIHLASDTYDYINPTLAIDTPKRSEFLENKVLEQALQNTISRYQQEGIISQASIYFKELETGRWTGISETAKYLAGKPFKLGLLMALYKQAEQDDQFLQAENNDPSQNQPPREKLIDSMILEKNTEHAKELYEKIDSEFLDEIYSDLGLEFSENQENEHILSPKSYSLLFRILYNATYLQRDFSEKALSLLSSGDHEQGISAALPKNIQTVHFSDTVLGNDFKAYSHDCGIMYYPQHPYVVCAMAITQQNADVDDFFQDIGTVIYNDMISKYHLQ